MDVQIGHEKTLTGLMPVLAGVDLVYGLGMIDMGMAISCLLYTSSGLPATRIWKYC